MTSTTIPRSGAPAHGAEPAGLRVAHFYSASGSAFDLMRPLGNGGMGHVYLSMRRSSRDAASGQLVALKLLRPDAPAHARRLFYHECTLVQRLQHPNIVQQLERGRGKMQDGQLFDFLALQFIAGETSEQLLRRLRSAIPADTALGIIAQITDALGYLHQRGIVHCDVKPGNIMLEHAASRAVLIDFGIARAPDFVGQPVAVGTPQYMAPEQIDPRNPCDGRVDLYALGVVMYELLTGRQLFQGRTTTDISQGRMIRPPLSDLSALLGAPIARVIDRCLRADPAERYPHAQQLLAELRQAIYQTRRAAQGGAER